MSPYFKIFEIAFPKRNLHKKKGTLENIIPQEGRIIYFKSTFIKRYPVSNVPKLCKKIVEVTPLSRLQF